MGSLLDRMRGIPAPEQTQQEKAADSTTLAPARKNPTRITKEEFRRAASAHTLDALDTLAEIMNNPDCKVGDRVRSAEVLLSYGAGKPTQAVELSGLDGGAIQTEATSVSVHLHAAQTQAPDRLAAIARILLNAGGAALLNIPVTVDSLPVGGEPVGVPRSRQRLLERTDAGAEGRAGEVVDAEDIGILGAPADGDAGGVPST